jgi:hypothetical protein
MIIAFICFVLAIAVGAWRQMCTVYEHKMPFNNPPIWRKTSVRVVTWLMSTSLSLIFATIFSLWVSAAVNEWVGKFSFGVFLYMRYVASAFFGAYPALKRCGEFNNEYDIENINYDALAEAMVKARHNNGDEYVHKEELIDLLKDSAKKISTDSLDDDERKALEAFRNFDKR